MKLDEAQIAPYTATPLPAVAGPWLVFAPHADDESFGMGGSIALAAQAGIAVHLVVLTDGALGGTQHDLVAIRKQETQQAVQVLGIHSVAFLEQGDRQLLLAAELVTKVVALIRTHKPRAVFFPGVFELHPDHRATSLLVWAALQRVADPTLEAVAYEIATQSPVNCLVDITAVLPAKQRAIACYGSQLEQKNYGDIVTAMNRLRSLTLGKEVSAAEGFYRYTAAELQGSLKEWARDRAGRLLD